MCQPSSQPLNAAWLNGLIGLIWKNFLWLNSRFTIKRCWHHTKIMQPPHIVDKARDHVCGSLNENEEDHGARQMLKNQILYSPCHLYVPCQIRWKLWCELGGGCCTEQNYHSTRKKTTTPTQISSMLKCIPCLKRYNVLPFFEKSFTLRSAPRMKQPKHLEPPPVVPNVVLFKKGLTRRWY